MLEKGEQEELRHNSLTLSTEHYKESQLAIGWDEEFCRRLDKIVLEDHPYVSTREERTRREKTWVLALNTQGPAVPM